MEKNMKSGKDKERENTRRNFLKLGALSAGALATGGIIQAQNTDSKPLSGKKTMVLSTDGKLIEVPIEQVETVAEPARGKAAREGIPGRKFVMVVDLSKCKNARKCVESCQKAHDLRPDQEFMKVFKIQDGEDTAPYWFPKPCFHCENAPCVAVCPVDATYKRTDGITLIDTDKCIGCKYCMVACPYSSRTFNFEIPENATHNDQAYSPETSVPVKTGVVSKCDFCPDQIRKGELPHCVKGCPMGAIYFGDKIEDAVCNGESTVRFSELMRDKAGFRYLEHFGTEPSVYYLPPVNRQFKFEEGLPKDEEKSEES